MLILKLISALTISVVIYVIVVEIITLNAYSHSSIRTNKTSMPTKAYPEKELKSKPRTYHDIEEKLKGYERTFVERKVGPYNLLGLGLWSNFDDDNEKFSGSDKRKHKDGSGEKHDQKEGKRSDSNEKGRFSRRDDSRPKSRYNRRDGSGERKRYKSRDSSEGRRYVSKDYFKSNERPRRRDSREDRGQFPRRRDTYDDRRQFRRRDGFEDRERYPRRDDFDRRDSYRRRDHSEERGGRNYRRSYSEDRNGGDRNGGDRRRYSENRDGGDRRRYSEDRDGGDRRRYSEDRDRGDRRRYSDDRGRERDDRRGRSGGDDRRGYAAGRGRFNGRENFGRDRDDRRGGRYDRKDFRDDRGSRKDEDGTTEAYGDWRTDPLRPTGDMGNYWDKIRLYTNDPRTMKVIYEFFGVEDPNKKNLGNSTKALMKDKYEKEKRREKFKKLKRQVRGMKDEWQHYKTRVHELEKYKNYSFTPKRETVDGFIESTTELEEEILNLEDSSNLDEE